MKIPGQQEPHTLGIVHHSKQSRHRNVIDEVKDKLRLIKPKVLENIETNIRDQCGEETKFYLWSCLDLEDRSTVDERVRKLRQLLEIFAIAKIHTVLEYADAKETKLTESSWQGFKVLFNYFCFEIAQYTCFLEHFAKKNLTLNLYV